MLAVESPIVMPTIVLAEIKYLYERKRIKGTYNEIRNQLDHDERVTVYPLDDMVTRLSP